MTGLRSKLGIQTQWDSGEALRYNMEVKPAAVMGINVAKAEWWQQLTLDNPGVHRIYRHHPNSEELGLTRWTEDPEGAALDFTAFLRGYLGSILDHIELVAGDNEFILGPDHESPNRIDKADHFMAAFVQQADYFLNKGVCVGNFNVGHWGPETVNYFPHTLTAIQAQAVQGDRLSYFCFHEYNWPLLRDDTHWYTGKFLRAMPPILEQYPDVPCMITELGIDKASCVAGEHAGFRKTHDDINIAVEGYCGDHGLAWYNDLLNQTDYVAAALIFGCGMGDWRAMGFDIMNNVDDVAILNRIKTYPVWIPEPPNGDDMDIKIYDYDGNLRDWDWLRAEFGDVQIHPVEEKFPIREGEHIYKVCYLRAKSGYAAILINTKDLDGRDIVGETVIFGWSSAEPHGLTDTGHNWTENGVPGWTNETGDVGPGMGTGAYYNPAAGERGPHWCWVHGRPSDYVDGLGMLDMTNHNHVDVGYCETIAGGVGPPVPPDPDGDLLIEARAINAKIDKIIELLGGSPPGPPVPELFHAEYFPNMDLSGEPVLTQEEDKIDHFWGSGSPGLPVPADYFSARWTGEFTFEEGTYEFTVLVDDGFRLWVDGLMRIETWKPQSPTEYKTTVALPAGKRPICAEYYEQAGGATCRLAWKKL